MQVYGYSQMLRIGDLVRGDEVRRMDRNVQQGPPKWEREQIDIREIHAADVDAIARIIGAPDVLRYTTWKGPADEEAAAAFVRTAVESAAAELRVEYLLADVYRDSGGGRGNGWDSDRGSRRRESDRSGVSCIPIGGGAGSGRRRPGWPLGSDSRRSV